MTVESNIFDELKSLVGNRVFPDVAPIYTERPYITYQQIGGDVTVFTDDSIAQTENGRFQINVWSSTRATAKQIIKQVEAALIVSAFFQARPESAPISTYDSDVNVYGAMQDFSIWSSR